MADRYDEIIKRITAIEKRLDKQLSFEPSKVVPLVGHARIIDDVTTRAAPYNINYQVSGAAISGGTGGNLPTASQITGIWYQLLFITATVTNHQMIIVDPDAGLSPVRFAGKNTAIGDILTGAGFCKLGAATGANPGQININLNGGSYSRFVFDVVAYLV